jgi:processive 1,2-diacylglycerol beta-glucosyltransferase
MYEERSTIYRDWQQLAALGARLRKHPSNFSDRMFVDLKELLAVVAHLLYGPQEREQAEKDAILKELKTHILFLRENIPLYYKGKTMEDFLRMLLQFEQHALTFLGKRKKILILYSCLGNGHNTAAEAVYQGLQYHYGKDYDIELIDFLQTANKIMNVTYKAAYDLTAKMSPSLYRWFFNYGDKTWQVKLVNYLTSPLLITNTEEMIAQYKPDLIVSTFPIWDFTIKNVWKKYSKQNKYISIITDSIRVQKAWITGDADYFIVSNEDTAKTLQSYHIPDTKIKVLGFPLRLPFYETVDRKKLMRQYGLDPDKKTILYSIGTGAKKEDLDSLLYLDKRLSPTAVQMIVAFGKNQLMKEKFDRLANKRLFSKTFAWTNEIPLLMDMADVIVTKAGGAFVMEAIQKELPMVITRVLPGQEEGNLALMQRYHIGTHAKNNKALLQAVQQYMYQKDTPQMKQNFKKVKKENATFAIVSFIKNVLEHEG